MLCKIYFRQKHCRISKIHQSLKAINSLIISKNTYSNIQLSSSPYSTVSATSPPAAYMQVPYYIPNQAPSIINVPQIVTTAPSYPSSTPQVKPSPEECIIYWDYQNMEAPSAVNFTQLMDTIKDEIRTKTGEINLPIKSVRLYCHPQGLPDAVSNELRTNAVDFLPVYSKEPQSVDHAIESDIFQKQAELAQSGGCCAVALISGDKDFGYVLSRIHHSQQIPRTILISIQPKRKMNGKLSQKVTDIIHIDPAKDCIVSNPRIVSNNKNVGESDGKKMRDITTIVELKNVITEIIAMNEIIPSSDETRVEILSAATGIFYHLMPKVQKILYQFAQWGDLPKDDSLQVNIHIKQASSFKYKTKSELSKSLIEPNNWWPVRGEFGISDQEIDDMKTKMYQKIETGLVTPIANWI
eukprot:382173_1